MTTADDLELLTVADVATLLKRPKGFVLALIRSGKLPVVQLAGDSPIDPHRRGRKDHRIARGSVRTFIESRIVRVGSTSPAPAPTPSPKLPVPKILMGWDGINRIKPPKSNRS